MQLPMITKNELREQVRARVAALPPQQVRALSASVWERLATQPNVAAAACILVYVSKGGEVDTHGLIRQLLALGKRVCVPAFDNAEQRYIASELRDFDSELTEGKFKILEPKPETIRRVQAATLDALLIPGLAFDRQGNRLGRGLGFFDAILRNTRGTKIALAYDFQVLNEIPAEPHDVGMDFIVTETRVVECKRK